MRLVVALIFCHEFAMVGSSSRTIRLNVSDGVINGLDCPEIRLPLFLQKRTQVGHRTMSGSCPATDLRAALLCPSLGCPLKLLFDLVVPARLVRFVP